MTRKRTLALAVAFALTAFASTAGAASGPQIDTAIDKGLLYLHNTLDAGGFWPGYGGYNAATTGAAVFAMLSQQSHWGANAALYQADVDKAMSYLLASGHGATKLPALSTRNDGVKICPGGALTCTGVFWNAGGEDTYTTGLIAPAIALYGATKGAGNVATATGPLAGMTWTQIAQGITNTFAAGQSTANQGSREGGWRYTLGVPTYDSDMSTTQWAAIAMIYNQTLGATTPSITRTDLAKWLAAVQQPSGVACYQPGVSPCDHADTGGLLLSLNFLGKGKGDPAVDKALAFLNSTWQQTATGTWFGNFDHPYAMWAVYKGLELNIGLDDTSAITNLRPGGCDSATTDAPTPPYTCNWWQDYNDFLVASQLGSGGWDGYGYWYGPLAAAFYLPILGGTSIPVEVPEPSTLALLGVSLLGVAGMRRRKGK